MKAHDINQVTGDIIDSALKVHRMFGPGMLESVYERLLAIELRKRGYKVDCQKPIGFAYEGESFDDAFRLDLLVDDAVVVELKSTGTMNPVFAKQLRTYLVLSGLTIGLVVNFGMSLLKDGIVRVINSHNLKNNDLCVSAPPRETNPTSPTELRSHKAPGTHPLCASAPLRETKPTFPTEPRSHRAPGTHPLCVSAPPRETPTTFPTEPRSRRAPGAHPLCVSAPLRETPTTSPTARQEIKQEQYE